jgi:hypothetical protein
MKELRIALLGADVDEIIKYIRSEPRELRWAMGFGVLRFMIDFGTGIMQHRYLYVPGPRS